jgi:succinate dehydrogenase/fumarate reductase flavoprotein subunit
MSAYDFGLVCIGTGLAGQRAAFQALDASSEPRL